MATKLYNSHLKTILEDCNEYFIIDTYVSLVSLCSEVNGKYLIQTYSDSKADLISLVRKSINATYKTIYNCIHKLINLNILEYNISLQCWNIVNMEMMHVSKDSSTSLDKLEATGYTQIRSFFLTPEFSTMKAREKRLLIYMAQLSDSKASKFHSGFSMNLLKYNSPWLKILRTKNKYYAKYTIEKMLKNYNHIFSDFSEKEREDDLAPLKNKRFKFFFNCEKIKNGDNEDQTISLVKNTFKNEYNLIKEKLSFFNLTLTNKKIMHLIRSISTLNEWSLKERVVQLVLNKYIAIQHHKSREDIKSLPAYAAAVVRSVVIEYNNFKEHIKEKDKISNYEVGEYYLDYVYNNKTELTFKEIDSSLYLLK